MTTRLRALIATGGALLFLLSLANCGGSGGGGNNGGDNDGGEEPPVATSVTLRGVVYVQPFVSPLAQASCRFVDQQDGQQLAATTASSEGAFELSVPPDVQGFIQCQPPALPQLTLSTFVSTVGQSPGSTIPNEDVTTATTLIVDILSTTAPEDPQARKEELLAELAMVESPLVTLVEAATLLYESLLAAQLDTEADFAGAGESGEGDGDGDGDGADDGGAEGEAGDGGEFSPIPGAVCAFTLDQGGMVGARTALADLFADGRVDLADLQPIANPIHTTLNGERRRAISSAFAELFPAGLGRPLQTIADGEGRYFLPLPPGVPGIIRCHPPEQANLVLTTCVRARAIDEVLDEDVTPRTTVVCDLVTDAQQASADIDREATKMNLLSRLEPLRILLSEDRNGNGMRDPGEVDEDNNGEFNTIARVISDTPILEEDRDVVLLASVAITIFDTMRIERANLSAEQTFAEAREDFFTDGDLSEPLAPIAQGIDNTFMDAANQDVLGTDDVVRDVVRAATTGTLSGTVSDENGVPLAGAEVVATQNGNEVGNTTTAEDGTFSIRNIPVGETTITASLGGFEVSSLTTQVVAIVMIDIELSPFPQIVVEPDTLMFGDVLVGETSPPLRVTIVNTGTAPLMVDEIETPGTSPFLLSPEPSLPVSVAPGGELILDLLYRPTTAGAAIGLLRVRSNAVNAPEILITLHGMGVPVPVPQLEVTPTLLDFGDVVVGQRRTQSLTVRNVGTADLNLSDVELDNPDAFSLSSSFPPTVRPGDMVTIDVIFEPPTEVALSGTLLLHSNAANTPATVTLRGTGIPASGSTGSSGGTSQ